MAEDRKWMYAGWKKGGAHEKEWMTKTLDFINRALSLSNTGTIRCPCSRCRNSVRHDTRKVQMHLCKYGFMPGYEVWVHHGESIHQAASVVEDDDMTRDDRMDEMLDAIRPEFEAHSEDPPTPEVQQFFDLLKASEEPLHEHTAVSILAFVTRLMAIKSKFAFSNNCYIELLKLISDILPANHKMPKDMYQSKKLLSGLGMEYEKIDVCVDNCMLFWKEHKDEKKCLKCGKSRFVEVRNDDGEMVTMKVARKQLRYMPLTPRLKQLFISKKTAKHMTWHKDGRHENDEVMVHPADSDAWRALDNFDPDFARDSRNVRIGLATDGFSPFNVTASSYSCWPVFAIPYNLPPSLCMKYESMFLCLIIPGPDHPGTKLNVMLQPLIEELKELWRGVEAYDCHKKQKFNLRVAYLWSVHDFMAYGIFSGWSCHGELTCPICGKETDCFRLAFGGKICYFDCHRRFLPLDHPFRSQKDAFRKDTVVTKEPLKRPSGTDIADMLSKLVPEEKGDGYVGYGTEHNWTHICGLWELPYAKALILMHNIDLMHQELSYFYRQLCAKEIRKDMMEKLEKEIPVLVCKLEKIFPPGFFNPMQHLLIHLPYEAKVGGPVQYRWMYLFERALKKLRTMVNNKARVEGCIAEEFKYKEISAFTSVYFAEENNVNAPTMRYHVDEDSPCSDLNIFQWNGTTVGGSTTYDLSEEERKSALLYMYGNMEEMEQYFT